METINVVAAIIRNEKQEILLVLRPSNKSFGDYWELPGGKINDGEKPEKAIIREIKEELNLYLVNPTFFSHHETIQNDKLIKIETFLSHINQPRFELKEHQDFLWISSIKQLPMNTIPVDVEILEKYFERNTNDLQNTSSIE